MLLGVKIAFPQVQSGLLWQATLLVPALFVSFFIMAMVYLIIPPVVKIRNDLIIIFHGQSCWIVKAETIKSIRIVIFAPDRIRLRIIYSHKEDQHMRTVGIAQTVDLKLLSQILPVYPEIRDARKQYTKSFHINNYSPMIFTNTRFRRRPSNS